MTNNNREEERRRNDAEPRREPSSLPGEIWRDFLATLRFWTVMVLCWALFTVIGAAVGYGIGGDNDGLWLGAAIVGGISPVLMGFALALDLPRKIWRKVTGRH